MMPHPYIGDAALYRQLFRYWKQLEDLVRSRILRAKAKLGTRDAALDRQLTIYTW